MSLNTGIDTKHHYIPLHINKIPPFSIAISYDQHSLLIRLCISNQAVYTVNTPITVHLGRKQNGMVLGGGGLVLGGFTVFKFEWGMNGGTVFGGTPV